MENAFGNIPEKIRRSRQEIEREIENSKSDLIESLRKEKSGLIAGISQREKELLKRVEKIHERALKRSRWKLCAVIFVLGVMIGAGSAAAWAWKNAQAFKNDDGTTSMWLKIK